MTLRQKLTYARQTTAGARLITQFMFEAEPLLELDGVEGIRAQIVDELGFRLDRILLNRKLFDDDLFDAGFKRFHFFPLVFYYIQKLQGA